MNYSPLDRLYTAADWRTASVNEWQEYHECAGRASEFVNYGDWLARIEYELLYAMDTCLRELPL